jgi:PAS domain S-box-containing protein
MPTSEAEYQQQIAALQERLQLQELISDLSTILIDLPPSAVDGEIKQGLKRIVEFLGIDRSAFAEISADMNQMFLTHTYGAEEKALSSGVLLNRVLPWFAAKLQRGEIFKLEHPDNLPDDAMAEKAYCQKIGLKSNLTIPVSIGGSLLCSIGFSCFRDHRSWPDELVEQLRRIAEIFGHAIFRKRAEERLQELYDQAQKEIVERKQAEQRFRDLIESAPNAMIISDRDGKIILINAQTEKLFGYAREKLLGMKIEALIPETHRHQHAQHRQVYYADPKVRPMSAARDLPGLRQDGTIMPIEVSLGPIQTSEGMVVMATIFDITERKHAEAELQKSYSEIKQLKDRLQLEADYLREEIKVSHRHGDIVGQSEAMQRVLRQVEQVASTDSSVLIQGETGAGKEVIARAVHNLSPRQQRVMVKVNCASLPVTLAESELFGREKGAYTGAMARQSGRFEVADGSTLFLDEVSELPMEAQAKLLRVLQEGEFERLGSPKTIKVDVRVIAASNRDLAAAVQQGLFREDLYYRLNVFPIDVPPLRERQADIPELAWTFVREYGEKMGKKIQKISRRTMEDLQRYPWPGNIRELRNVIERAMIISTGSMLIVQIPMLKETSAGHLLTMAEMEAKHIKEVLEKTKGRIRGESGAAAILGLNPSTLYSRMEKLGIQYKRENIG